MLNSKLITSELAEASVIITADSGCLQGLDRSPFNRSAVSLLVKLNDLGFKTLGYVYDLAISVMRWHEQTLTERKQRTLSIAHK